MHKCYRSGKFVATPYGADDVQNARAREAVAGAKPERTTWVTRGRTSLPGTVKLSKKGSVAKFWVIVALPMSASLKSNGFATLPSPEAHSILEMSAAVKHLPSDAIMGAMTVPIFRSETMDNRRDTIAQSLFNTVQQLQNKIAVTMPKPRETSFFT